MLHDLLAPITDHERDLGDAVSQALQLHETKLRPEATFARMSHGDARSNVAVLY